MRTVKESLAAIVVQYTRRRMHEHDMKVKGSQPLDWKRTRATSFRHPGMTRVSAKESEQKYSSKFPGLCRQ